MFYAIEFVEENSVAVVNDLWMKGTEYALWSCTLVTLVGKMVKEGLPPPPQIAKPIALQWIAFYAD